MGRFDATAVPITVVTVRFIDNRYFELPTGHNPK